MRLSTKEAHADMEKLAVTKRGYMELNVVQIPPNKADERGKQAQQATNKQRTTKQNNTKRTTATTKQTTAAAATTTPTTATTSNIDNKQKATHHNEQTINQSNKQTNKQTSESSHSLWKSIHSHSPKEEIARDKRR